MAGWCKGYVVYRLQGCWGDIAEPIKWHQVLTWKLANCLNSLLSKVVTRHMLPGWIMMLCCPSQLGDLTCMENLAESPYSCHASFSWKAKVLTMRPPLGLALSQAATC